MRLYIGRRVSLYELVKAFPYSLKAVMYRLEREPDCEWYRVVR